jgi:hypothetical protein
MRGEINAHTHLLGLPENPKFVGMKSELGGTAGDSLLFSACNSAPISAIIFQILNKAAPASTVPSFITAIEDCDVDI